MTDNKQVVNPYFSLTELVQREFIACQHNLTQFQQVTSATYEGIAQDLPVIMTRIEDTNEDARTLIEYFIASDIGQVSDRENSSASVVSNTVREAKLNMVTVSKQIHHMFKIDQDIFRHIQKQVDQIESLRQSILEI